MPTSIIIALLSLLGALILYTVAVWRAFRAKGFSAGTLVILWAGVAFDVLATAMMGMQVGGLDLRPGAPLLHTVLALLALGGMILGAVASTWAHSAGRSEVAATASRWLIAPWALWVAVFVWGMITRGSARLSA